MKNRFLIIFFGIISNCVFSQTWHSVGNGIGKFGYIECLREINDTLYLGGVIEKDSNAIGNGIIRFDGLHLDSLGCGPNGRVDNIETFIDGKIYIVGPFIRICNDINYGYIAKWNGIEWEQFTGAIPVTSNIGVVKFFNNQLYFGGDFFNVNGISVNRIASWDGTSWHDVGGGIWDPMPCFITDMAVYKGKLIVVGNFIKAGSINANYIASWDGTKWDSLGGGLNDNPTCLCVDTTHDLLYVGGYFTQADTLSAHGLAMWDGTNWSVPFRQCITPYPKSISIFNNKLYVGGEATSNPPSAQDTIFSCWDGTKWKKIIGPNGDINALSVYKSNLYVGGQFSNISGDTAIKYIACYGNSCPLNVGLNEVKKDQTEYLWQNIPNPFSSTTSIPYFVPKGNIGSIQIVDATGNLMKIYKLSEGKNNLDISLAQLNPGIYYYSIFINGIKKQTLKMMVN